MDKALQVGFGIFGNIIGLLLFSSPMITFKRIVMNRSTEQFSGIPYVMTLFNCLLTSWYGMPFVSPNNLPVAILNAIGATLEAIYVVIFLIFAPRREKAKIFGILVLVLTLFLAIALVSMLLLDGANRNVLCGLASSIFAVIMYASPLSIMKMVIKTKSVEFMPFFLSLFVFIAGTSWFIFGLIVMDAFLYVPNGFGSALGAVQLILYAIYCKNRRPATEKLIEDE